jgi:hypothetical protein
MIYDFSKASADEFLELSLALAEELAAALREVAVGYIVMAAVQEEAGFCAPFMLRLRSARKGEDRYWAIGFSVGPIADSSLLTREILCAFERFTRISSNERGATEPRHCIRCDGLSGPMCGHGATR